MTTIEDHIEEFIRLRDKKSEIVAHAKDLCAKLDEKMDVLESDILKKFAEVGIESARTKEGTAYVKTTRLTSVGQWDDLLPWIQASGNWHMLTRAANKTAVLEYLDEHEELPPGINLVSKIELGVNRPKATRKAA